MAQNQYKSVMMGGSSQRKSMQYEGPPTINKKKQNNSPRMIMQSQNFQQNMQTFSPTKMLSSGEYTTNNTNRAHTHMGNKAFGSSK